MSFTYPNLSPNPNENRQGITLSLLNDAGREADTFTGRDNDWNYKPPVIYDAYKRPTLAVRKSEWNYDTSRTLYRPMQGKTANVGPANLWRYHAEPEPMDFAEFYTFERKTPLAAINDQWGKQMEATPGANHGGMYMMSGEIQILDKIFSTNSWGQD